MVSVSSSVKCGCSVNLYVPACKESNTPLACSRWSCDAVMLTPLSLLCSLCCEDAEIRVDHCYRRKPLIRAEAQHAVGARAEEVGSEAQGWVPHVPFLKGDPELPATQTSADQERG